MANFDTSWLLELIRQHTAIPAVPGFTDEDCLRLATAELHGLLPRSKRARQKTARSSEDATYTVALQKGRAAYSLVLPSTCAQVTAKDVGDVAGTYAVENAPAGLIGSTVDVVRNAAPWDNVAIEVVTVTDSTVGGSTRFFFNGGDPGLQVGDWLCPVGTSPFPQLAPELHIRLAERVASKQLQAIGEKRGGRPKASSGKTAEKKKRAALERYQERVRSNPHAPTAELLEVIMFDGYKKITRGRNKGQRVQRRVYKERRAQILLKEFRGSGASS